MKEEEFLRIIREKDKEIKELQEELDVRYMVEHSLLIKIDYLEKGGKYPE